MAIEAQLFDGTIVEFPDDTDRSVIEKTVKRLTAERQEKEPKEETSTLRRVADQPINFAQGVVSGVRAISDAFGADNPISKNLRGVEDYVGSLLSAQAQNNQQEIARIMAEAKDKGVLDQVKDGFSAFMVAPADVMVQAFGTIIPTLVGGLAGRAIGLGARATGLGTGTVMGSGITKGAIYDAVKEELAKTDMPPAQIEQRAIVAQEYGGQNLDQILMGAAFGGLGAATGIEKILLPGAVKNVMTKAASKSAIARGVGTGFVEGGTEFGQGFQEQVAQNVALQREGFDRPTFQGAFASGTMEGLAGFGLGTGVGALSRPQPTFASPPDASLNVPVEPEAPFTPPATPIAPPAPPAPPPALSQEEIDRQASYEQQMAVQNARQEQAARGNQFMTTPSPYLSQAEAAIQPGQRERAQGLAAQQFGLNVGDARAPVTEQDRINRQLAAQQQMDADRFQQQTPLPQITPAQALPRVGRPTLPPQAARAFDRQADLLGQMQGLPQVEQTGLAAQADIAGRTGQVDVPQTRFVDLTPMPPRVARQKLAALQADSPDANLNIVPHPQMGGRFAIEERVAPVEETPEPLREDRPSVSQKQAVEMVRNVQRTGVITPEASAAAQQYGLNIDPMLMNFAERTTPESLLVQQRRGMADEAALNAELRGGVATPEEAQRLRETGMGRPYDFIQQPAPESRQLGLSERERRLNAEEAAAQERANRDPEAIARRRFQEKLQGPEVDFLEGFDVNMNAEPGPASPEFTEQFMKPEGRYSLSGEATPELKATVEDMRKQLLPILKRFGLGNLGLRLVDSIENGKADGMYAQQIITLALDSDSPLGVMRHEVVHALRALGAFTPAEWKVLTKAAKDKWINQFFDRAMQDQYQAVYLEQNGNLDGFQEYLQEEAIAQAFRYFSDPTPKGALNEFQRPSGRVANLMRRLNEFFKAIRDFFASKDLPIDEMFLPNRIFADIERGAIQPGRAQGRAEELPSEWKATPADEEQAVDYALENGILPYLSDGQMQVSVPQAKFSLKPAYTEKQIAQNKGNNHPLFGLPINKNGTITLYLPTNNAEARRVVRDKKLQGNTPAANRIYLTNESNGAKVMQNPGNIDHTMDGANVMIQVNPDFLQLDQEYADGRKDFFIPIAEGEAFAKKMAQTKLFTLDAPRDRAISKETTLGEIEAKIQESIASYKAMPVAERRKKLAEARKILKTEHNVGTLLSENGKLQKTRVGDYGIKFDGNSVASMGLGLASAQKITEKLSTCPRSARCESLCLGETSGQNLLYGGEGQFKSGPRLSQYLKTEAMVMHPEEFAIALYNEIDAFRKWSAKETGTETTTNEAGEKVKVDKQAYQPAIRLNVTSDFAPKVFDSIIQSFPDVEFYDYTKLNTKSIAPNHHLTYSSDGVAQTVNGKTVGVGSNWKEMTKKLDGGFNVAMAFTSRKAMPEFLLDEATEKKYQVWNGDNYDARFLDPKPGESGNKLNQGMIIGLTNKDRTGKPEDAAIKNDGFFVDYDPARDGKTLTIKDQSKFAKEKPIAMPSKKFSLRAPTTPEFKRFFKDSKVVDKDGNPLVVYHGTNQDINEFTTQPNALRSKFYAGEIGSWFGDDPKVANNFARGISTPREKGAVYPAFLNIKNPKTYNSYEEFMSDAKGRRSAPALRKDLIKQGFDGIHIKDSDTDFGGRRDDWVAFYPTQIKSATGNRGTFDATNPDIRFSLRAPKTPEFKRFFGNSKVVNPDGTPKVMYHGTARIIDEFLPKQAGAIFVTDNPDFAESFSEDSLQFMVTEQRQLLGKKFADMSPDDQLQLLKKGYKLGVKQKALTKADANKALEAISEDFANRKYPTNTDFNNVAEFFDEEIKIKLQSGQNIMPLYVRAENPFDYENIKHIDAIQALYPYSLPDDLKRGSWKDIESNRVQELIKEAGFDGFYVKERGEKNLAVYNPNQIKSAIGNRGTYDETGRILYSLKNAPPNRYTKLTDDPTLGKTIAKVTESTLNVVRNDASRTSSRIQFIDTSAGLAKTLSSMPLFDTNGTLRADMLHHSKANVQNIINTGLVSGNPTLNDDGTIIIERTENNLARSLHIADSLNNNPNVLASGLSGKELIAEVARGLRGADILAEDAETRALGEQQISDANFFTKELEKELKAGKITPTQVVQFQGQIDKLRKLGNENRKVNRELQVKPEDIAWAKKQLDLIPEVQEVLDIWNSVNTALVTLQENTGMIDKETADKYRANKNYVPLFKSREDLDDSAFFRGSGTKSTPKQKALKGADITRNIWENIYKQYAMMTAAAFENQTRRVSVEQMRSISEDLAIITTPNDNRVNLRYRDKGKDVDVIIENPNDLAAFQSMTYQISPVMKFLGGFTSVLRAGALLNPMFWIRELVRNPIQATITGQSGIVTPFHSMKEFLLISGSPEARLLAERGVLGKIYSDQSLNDYLENVGTATQIAPNMIQKTYRRLMKIHEAADAATRVAIFKKAKAKALKDGLSEPQAIDLAVMKAREYINFSVMGNSPTLANLRQMIPFMNATIVGLDALYRAYTGIGLNPEERAKVRRTFRTRAAMMFIMSIAYAVSLQDDEDYQKLPDYVKDNNILFPIGFEENKRFLKFSIPYEVGFLFKTLPELLVRYLAGSSTGKEVLASLRAGFIQNMPSGGTPVPQFIKPVFEVIANKSFFNMRPIEGISDSRLPVAQRGERASELAKMMSGLGLDKILLSPAKIDVLTKGYFAEFGAFFNELTDAFIATTSGKEKTPRNIQNLPFMKAFLTDPQVNKAISDFYDIENNATQVANLFSKYKSEGQGEMLREMIADPEKLKQVGGAPVMRRISRAMSDIQKAIRIIDKNQEMSPEERRARINELQQQLGVLAERGKQVADTMGLSR
jgi:hypothetical protein